MVGNGVSVGFGGGLVVGIVFGVRVFACVGLVVGVTMVVDVHLGETGDDDCEQPVTSKSRRRISILRKRVAIVIA